MYSSWTLANFYTVDQMSPHNNKLVIFNASSTLFNKTSNYAPLVSAPKHVKYKSLNLSYHQFLRTTDLTEQVIQLALAL